MRSILLLVKRDLRKRPGQAVGMFLMAMLAGLLANVGVLLATSYTPNLAEKTAAWNAPDTIAMLAKGPAADRIVEKLRANPDIHDLEVSDMRAGVGSVPYGNHDLAVTVSLYDTGAPVRMNKRTVVETLSEPVQNPVWAPAVLFAAGHYKLGDEITITMATGEKHSFHIQGFVEDTFGGVPGFGSLSFGLAHDDYAGFTSTGLAPTLQVKMDASDPMAGSNLFSRAVADVTTELRTTTPEVWTSNLEYVSSGAGLSAGMFSTILVAFATIIVVVAAVVMRFLLRNLINVDMASFGMLRAGGYTTGRIMASLVATFAGIAVIASGIGVGLSYALLPAIRASLRAQNGISWVPGFSPLAAAVTIGGLALLVGGTAVLAARRVRRMSTVNALRGGTATHSFRPSPLPLATTRGPVQLLLGVKSAIQQLHQTVVIAITVAIVSFAAVFTMGMTTNLLGDPNQAIEMLVGELEDVSVITKPGVDPESLKTQVAGLSGVQKVFVSSQRIEIVDGSPVAFQITADPTEWRYDPVHEGRLPRQANEVVLGARIADRLGLQVGGTYRVDIGKGSQEYLISGIASGGRNLGQFVLITTDAYERLDPAFKPNQLVVYANGDSGSVVSEIRSRFGGRIEEAVDSRANVGIELSGYLSAVPVLSGTLVTFTGIVVALVVGLIVTTMLVQSRRDLGIKKAMGYTARQLGAQTRWTYLPAVGVGALVGAMSGALATGPLLGALLRNLGILKVDVQADWLTIIGIPVGVVVLAWLVIQFTSRRIKRVSAYALVTE